MTNTKIQERISPDIRYVGLRTVVDVEIKNRVYDTVKTVVESYTIHPLLVVGEQIKTRI